MRDLDHPEDARREDIASKSPTSSSSSRTKKTTRWVIRVTYPNGEDAYLRHGAVIGEGPIVRFGTKRLADINAGFVSEGLPDGATVTVVRANG